MAVLTSKFLLTSVLLCMMSSYIDLTLLYIYSVTEYLHILYLCVLNWYCKKDIISKLFLSYYSLCLRTFFSMYYIFVKNFRL